MRFYIVTQIINQYFVLSLSMPTYMYTRLIDGDENTQMVRLYGYRLELMKTHPCLTIKFRCDAGVSKQKKGNHEVHHI